MKRRALVASGLAAGAVAALGRPARAQARIAYGTTNPQSSVYTYAVAAAKAINTVSGSAVNLTVLATGGAIDNLVRMSRGQIQLGLGNMAAVYQAYRGLDRFEGRGMPKLRGLWLYQTSIEPYIVRADSNIRTLQDLNGRPWTAGQRGSATEALVMRTLEVLGIKPDYHRASLADALEAIKNGRSLGYAKAMAGRSLDAATMELAVTTPIRVLSFTPDQAERVRKELPYISFITVREGTIPGVNGFTTWAASSGHYTLPELLNEEQVAAILKGVVDGRSYQEEVWPVMRGTDIIQDTIDGMTIPLHSGAVKFFRSRGYTVPAALVPPEAS